MEQAIQTERFAASVIFDDFNERLRIEDYRGYVPALIAYAIDTARQKGYTKLIVKARYEHLSIFIEQGFQYEGWIQGYFSGSDAHFLVFYFQQERKMSENVGMEDQIVASIQAKPRLVSLSPLPAEYTMRKAEPADAEALVNLYQSIFAIYPSPLHDRSYVESALKKGAMFYVVEHDKQIVSAASAEINEKYHNAELTDCATLPHYRTHGLMKHLLKKLEEELKKQAIFCVYSLARAPSHGMNAAFYQLGYRYSGRLTNNCYIYNDLEDMNIWVKDISSA